MEEMARKQRLGQTDNYMNVNSGNFSTAGAEKGGEFYNYLQQGGDIEETPMTQERLRLANKVVEEGAQDPRLTINNLGQYVPATNQQLVREQGKINRMHNPIERARAQKQLDRKLAIYKKSAQQSADVATRMDDPMGLKAMSRSELLSNRNVPQMQHVIVTGKQQ